MIIATGSVDINEATKIAQIASDSADDLADKLKNTVSTMDGKTTVSTSTPFDDGKEHNEGDMWTVINDDVASAMYIYTDGQWQVKKWDQETLSVKELAALTSKLGHVTAGIIESSIINGTQINGGTITGSAIDQDFTSSDGTHFQLWADYNGFHYKATGNNSFDMRMDSDGINIQENGGSLFMTKTGGVAASNSVSGNGLTISGHTLSCGDGGALYFENYAGGGNMADIHAADVYSNGLTISGQTGAFYFENHAHAADIRAADVYSNGSKLKSALSAKRDVTDYSPDEALSAVMNTDVKKWKYKDSDNSADSQHIGPIIDDVNPIGDKTASIANDMISTDENGDYFLNESNTISILLAALKKSNQRIDELSYRITQLERKNVQ